MKSIGSGEHVDNTNYKNGHDLILNSTFSFKIFALLHLRHKPL